ncbi:MAG TPA: extracellular solute-binding protein [Candidatus Acidoferrales bacterium]|nr:extracellular solute-binding protein [Candidatus Acidoferrales bacterium]
MAKVAVRGRRFSFLRRARRSAVVSGAVLACLWGAAAALAASQAQLIEGAKKEGEVILYASMNIEEANTMIARFQQKYPFVKVKLNRTGSEKLLTKYLAEARAKKSFADVIQTLGFSMYTLRKSQMLGHYLSPENRFYPKEFKEEGYWTTVYTNPYVVAYNPRLVARDALPRSYGDLLRPAWKGKMMMEPTKVDWFGGMLQIMGKEKGLKYMRDLAKQDIMTRIGHDLIAQLVAAGEAHLDIDIPAPSVDRVKKRGAPIDWVALPPSPASMIGIGLVTQPVHPHAARLYVDFVLSKEGQQILADMGRYLAREEFMREQAAKAKGLEMTPVNPDLAENMAEYMKLMREIFGQAS